MADRYVYIVSDKDTARGGRYTSRAAALAAARALYFDSPDGAWVTVQRFADDSMTGGAMVAVYTPAEPPRRSKALPPEAASLSPLAARVHEYSAARGLSAAAVIALLVEQTGLSCRSLEKWVYEGAAPSRASARAIENALDQLTA